VLYRDKGSDTGTTKFADFMRESGTRLHDMKNVPLSLKAYSDAAMHRIGTDRATCAFVITLSGFPLLWVSRKMTLVATSVFMAELNAAFGAAEEINFLRGLLSELRLFNGGPIELLCDNIAAIDFADREATSEKGRHMPLKYQLLRKLSHAGIIRMSYVQSISNPADLLTKPLNHPRVLLLRDRMGVQS
jgi:hypothetical protein